MKNWVASTKIHLSYWKTLLPMFGPTSVLHREKQQQILLKKRALVVSDVLLYRPPILLCPFALFHLMRNVNILMWLLNGDLRRSTIVIVILYKEAMMVLIGQLSATCRHQATATQKIRIHLRTTTQRKK